MTQAPPKPRGPPAVASTIVVVSRQPFSRPGQPPPPDHRRYDKCLYEVGVTQQRLRDLDERAIEVTLKKLAKLEPRPTTDDDESTGEDLAALEASVATLTAKLTKAHEKLTASMGEANGGVPREASGRVVLSDAVTRVLKQAVPSKVPKAARIALEKVEDEVGKAKEAAAQTQVSAC